MEETTKGNIWDLQPSDVYDPTKDVDLLVRELNLLSSSQRDVELQLDCRVGAGQQLIDWLKVVEQLEARFDLLIEKVWQYQNSDRLVRFEYYVSICILRKEVRELLNDVRKYRSVCPLTAISTTTNRFEYDVFLSFGGPRVPPDDFTSLLYQELKDAGFRVYVGDGEIRSPEDIYPELPEAIEKSRLSIPIFSPCYASDMNHLNEVAKIRDCSRSEGQFVLPVFYNVGPSEVCNQKGPFWRPFHQHHEKGVSPQVLYDWKTALKEIGELNGYHVHGFEDELEVIDRIPSKVDELLKPYEVQLDGDYLVAMEQPVEHVLQLFSRSVQIVGICGIPGIGKTTLAKALYHKLLPEFEHCCFIISIRERSKRKGLYFLQNQLIKELLPMGYARFSSFKENLKFIEDRFCNMRVLIVLDDVECLDHIKAFGEDLQCFGPGSRIILTTRKPELLVEAKVPHRYFVQKLDDVNSVKLFYRYAFEEQSPKGEYYSLSTRIALHSRGIPRVIVSVGSYLSKYRNKERQKWEEVLEQLISCQYKPLQESLMLSQDDFFKGQWHFHDAECFPMEEKLRQKGKEVVLSQSIYPSTAISTTTNRFEYDVFLNFGGAHVPSDGFGSLLYKELKDAGFQVYVDDGEIRSSEDIYPELPEAIEKSRLSIPIFSLDYASDMSRLKELAKIRDCWRLKGQIILPVFYYVEPSEFCNQMGPFWRSFHRHQEKGVSLQILYNWRKALKEIGGLNGYNFHIRGDEAEGIGRILSKVVELLKPYEVRLDDDYLVAMEQPVLNVLQLFSGSVQIVGICGIPGIGKTTLAKALYHILLPEFKHRCFIINIRERSKRKGLYFLQNRLIKELIPIEYGHFSSFEENLKFIGDRFRNMRVLIVLDDVECLDHIKAFGVDLQCFGPGSRIILTTRKPKLLVEAKVPHRYFVEELDEPHSLELFCSYTFVKDSPEGEYSHLSAEIAASSKGIPRVIQSVGSYLSKYRNREKEKWEVVLQQLRSCQYEPLQESLTLSHDDLSKGQWHFYHDTANFPMQDSNDIAHYEVVLSFDARDRVKNLVESLHRRMEGFGIGIFALNGDSMQVNDIGKIFIPILSKSYVSNSSCLEMLAHMVECSRSTATNHILPIFFAFEPSSDDRLQTRLYESCSRWLLPETFTIEEYHNLINSVCRMALDKLKLNQSMENRLVGIDEHVESILNLLNLEVNDVRSIAIRGEDGTGKTTLAKIMYHQLSSSFEGCSFLAEIDERTQHNDGITYLQAKLISDLLDKKCKVFASVSEGISLIKQRFQHMRVLIILDDVAGSSHMEDLVGQLDWFGPGSRILIIANINTEIPLPHSNYKIQQTWAIKKAQELFNMHALRHPLPKFCYFSLKFAVGLDSFERPCLALEIVGSLLYGKDKKEWDDMFKSVRDMDLKKILRMSYDRLDEMQKKTFLDISCIPIDLDRRLASYLWYDSFHSSAFLDIEALILLSLVRVDANNEIWMHRVVRDFGREIADRGETECVQLEFPASLGFERMDNVRFLKLDHANANGSTNRVVMRQRDFIWQCSLDLLAGHEFQRLEVLDMSWSKISEDWEGWDKIKVPLLRVLNLTGCSTLMLTPNFSFCPNLEMLILEQCSRLVRIDPSICKLQCLMTLSLRYCLELRMLPGEVGCLTALRDLFLDGTSLQEFPSSIGRLENLHILTAVNCFSLSFPPGSSRKLQSVTICKLDYANITELPFFIGEKMKLRHLSLRGCHGIKTLAALVGEVESSLVELDVSETSISKLPASIIKLKALRVLKLESCFIREFPPGFGELKRLEEIHASWCRNLKQLPDDVGKLKSLRILMLRDTRISNVPESIQYLGCLQTLDCTSCNKLQNLPKLPFSLTSLHVESKRLRTGGNDFLYWLHGCSSLRTLGLCFPSLTDLPAFPDSLITLTLRCKNLKNIPPLPSKIVVLSIQDCASLMEMPNLENLKNLQEMEILCCPGVQKIEGLERLQAMRVLTVSSSGIVSLNGLDKLTSLTRLTISDCPSLHEFPDPSVLKEQGVGSENFILETQ